MSLRALIAVFEDAGLFVPQQLRDHLDALEDEDMPLDIYEFQMTPVAVAAGG